MVRKKVHPHKNNLSPTSNNITKNVNNKPAKVVKYKLNCNYQGNNYKICKLLIGSTFNVLPEKWLNVFGSFIIKENKLDVLHLMFDKISVIITLIIDHELLKDIFFSKIFTFEFIVQGEEFYLNVFLTTLPLPKFNARIGSCLKNLLGIDKEQIKRENEIDDENLSDSNSLSTFYTLLRSKRMNVDELESDVQHPYLVPNLRPYQVSAVKWMLYREKNYITEKNEFHPLFAPIKLESGQTIFVNKESGYVTMEYPFFSTEVRGGILAEEMGLGKTVEFLACILNHPYQKKMISNEDNFDQSPIIEKNMKVIRSKKRKETNAEKYVTKERIVKVPEDWVKNASKKSSTRLALEMWYNSVLSGGNTKTGRESDIECICGETHQDDVVGCVMCGKRQHASCLGYKDEYGDYKCPSCWSNEEPLLSGATLIVTPQSLRNQWCNEIKKHLRVPLKVLVYEGSRNTPIYPTQLSRYDIVITTYNVLQADFHLVEVGEGFKLRRKRRYDFVKSPLVSIKWWRLCLDEAQMVEAPTKMISMMAGKLMAEYRWAITGTPISKNLSDLYGLINFLQIEPYNEQSAWEYLLYKPYLSGHVEPITDYFAQVMWRSSKNEVYEQINIPKQTIVDHWLDFSAIEKYFYGKEHSLSRIDILNKLKKFDLSLHLAKVDKQSLKKIMLPLLSLRQACVYPNTAKGRYLATRKQVGSMKELLDALILQNSTESEEHLRLIVSSLNGLAGIYTLMENHLEAAAKYRQVLQLHSEYSGTKASVNVKMDTLQFIHTLHNLSELLRTFNDIPPTLRDETLKDEYNTQQQKYIKKFANDTKTALNDFNKLCNSIDKMQEEFVLKMGQWYSDGIEWIIINNFVKDLKAKIQTNHDSAEVKCPIDLDYERNILRFVAKWDEDIYNLRQDCRAKVMELIQNQDDDVLISQKLVCNATECHLRPLDHGVKKKKCDLCLVDSYLKKYEIKLFTMTKRTKHFEDMALQGSWKAASEEIILRSLVNVLKNKSSNKDFIKDGEKHSVIMDQLKKEFKELRKLWTFIYQQVAAQDELDMCKIKLRIEENGKKTAKNKSDPRDMVLKQLSYALENKVETIHMLSSYELEFHRTTLINEEQNARMKLQKTLGIKNYLETLRKQQYEGQSPDPCPICHNQLENHWAILLCGHAYCMDCIHTLLEKVHFGKQIYCSVCREKQNTADISYIKTEQSKIEDNSLDIKGNYSTKIEAIVKLVLTLTKEDKNVKVLIFSSWMVVLNILHKALTLNSITTELLVQAQMEKRLEKFKNENITVLLLPVNLGARGLNLIEATHVILTEPLLDPSDELQLFGRVHRIGQVKPTFVHKFFIRNTIEENISNAVKGNSLQWEKNNITLKQLQDLFLPEHDIYHNSSVQECDD